MTYSTCAQCGKSFRTFPSQPRRCCSRACDVAWRIAQRPTATCAGCGKAYSRIPAMLGRYCSPRCYQENGRRGNRQKSVKGYRMTRAKGHPIAPPSGIVPVSRLVLYDKIGPGPHPCHLCGKPVDWTPGDPYAENALFVDHIDWNRTNDTPGNLAPSCNICNAHRRAAGNASLIQPGEHTKLINGRPTRAVERHCNVCGKPFLVIPAEVAKGNGRYCSRQCMYARNR